MANHGSRTNPVPRSWDRSSLLKTHATLMTSSDPAAASAGNTGAPARTVLRSPICRVSDESALEYSAPMQRIRQGRLICDVWGCSPSWYPANVTDDLLGTGSDHDHCRCIN